MILKILTEEEQEQQYNRLDVWRQLNYHSIVNEIDKEKENFIVAVDINEELKIGQVIKMHYIKNGTLVIDSIEIF